MRSGLFCTLDGYCGAISESRWSRIVRILSTAGIAFILITAGMTACGEEKGPTGPEADLAGTWIFEGTDFAEVLSGRLVNLFVEAGLSRSDAQTLVDEALSGIAEDVGGVRSTMRLNADNTWQDDSGNRGTWRIEDDVLALTDEDDTVQRFKCFLDGDDLTLILTKEYFLSLLRQMDGFDAVGYEFYREILGENDVFRFFFKRKSGRSTG